MNGDYFEFFIAHFELGQCSESCLLFTEYLEEKSLGNRVLYLCDKIKRQQFSSQSKYDITLLFSANNMEMNHYPGFKIQYKFKMSTTKENLTNICERGWFGFQQSCFKLMYSSKVKSSNWIYSENQCNQLGGHLASISNSEEMIGIKEILLRPEILTKSFQSSSSTIFIGLRSHKSGGKVSRIHYRWTNGKPLTYTEWYPNPEETVFSKVSDNLKGLILQTSLQPTIDDGYECVAMMIHNPRHHANWIKIPCSLDIYDHSYLCEKRSTTLNLTLNSANHHNRNHKHNDEIVHTTNDYQWQRCKKGWYLGRNKCHMLFSVPAGQPSMSWKEAQMKCKEKNSNVDLIEVNKSNLLLLGQMFRAWRYFLKAKGRVYVTRLASKFHIEKKLLINDFESKEILKSLKFVDAIQAFDSYVLADKEDIPTRNVLCSMPAHVHTISQSCKPQFFTCPDKSCISVNALCDNQDDCKDGMDEENCDPSFWFICKDGSKIPWSKYCDYRNDCNDKSDEKSCIRVPCTQSQWQCTETKQCISLSKRCDGVTFDCKDGTDEESCNGECQGFRCNKDLCLPISFVNDSQVDCPGIQQNDEISYEKLKQLASNYELDLKLGKYDCQQDFEERCSYYHPHCFPRNKTCVYDINQFGKQICPNMEHLNSCKDIYCIDMFKCGGTHPYCLPTHRVCDGVQDCVDGSDEIACHQISCVGHLRCRNNVWINGTEVSHMICVSPNNICDGVIHCLNEEDETYCDMICPNGFTCMGYTVTSIRNYPVQVSQLSTSTRFLNLSGNNRITLYNRMFHTLLNLGYLNMNSMNITELPQEVFFNLENLVELHLNNNFICTIRENMFRGLQSLSILHLYANPIKVLQTQAFAGLRSLKNFYLINTLIETLPDNLFNDSFNIKFFNISLNKDLHTISDHAFQGLKKVDVIDLRYVISNMDIKNDLGIQLSERVFEKMHIKSIYTNHYGICCLMKSGVMCKPDADNFSNCSDLLSNSALRVTVWVLGISALIGNLVVFLWRMITHEYKKPAMFFVINLSVSDFFMAIYLIIIGSMDALYRGSYIVVSAQWRASILCRLAGVLSGVSSQVGVSFLFLITLERYLAIVYHFKGKRFTRRSAIFVVIIVWIFWIMSALTPLIMSKIQSQADFFSPNSVCLPYVLSAGNIGNEKLVIPPWAIGIYSFIIFASIVLLYCLIFRHMHMSRKNAGRPVMVNDYLMARRLLLLIGVNFISCAPVNILSFLAAFGEPIDPLLTTWVTVFVIPLNAALNPYLYTISNAKICVAKKESSRQNRQMIAILNSALEYRKRISDVSNF